MVFSRLGCREMGGLSDHKVLRLVITLKELLKDFQLYQKQDTKDLLNLFFSSLGHFHNILAFDFFLTLANLTYILP